MSNSRTNTLSKEDFDLMLNQAREEMESLKDPFFSVAQKPMHMRFRQYLQNKASEIKTTIPLVTNSVIVTSKNRAKEF